MKTLLVILLSKLSAGSIVLIIAFLLAIIFFIRLAQIVARKIKIRAGIDSFIEDIEAGKMNSEKVKKFAEKCMHFPSRAFYKASLRHEEYEKMLTEIEMTVHWSIWKLSKQTCPLGCLDQLRIEDIITDAINPDSSAVADRECL